ncbi:MULTISPECIES: hypothetical protein [unclassified Mycobacterium]|uniref:hypothetical protein n=1 Tax=unclassified Mycobacterium TaxID=2642494 RepID=UPI000AA6DE5C|nr:MULTISPECIES: hypothetical protein [unclassified Mycobacterium]
MKRNVKGLCVAGAALGGLATVAVTPAVAAPTESEARQTISDLESQGYRVILSKVGTKAIDECAVSAVRQGRSVTGPQVPVGAASITSFNPGQNLQYTTVYVDLDCRR